MNTRKHIFLLTGVLLTLITLFSVAKPGGWDGSAYDEHPAVDSTGTDTTKKEKVDPYKKSAIPDAQLKDRHGDAITDAPSKSPIYLKEPSNIKTDIQLDESGENFIIQDKIGDMDYRAPSKLDAKKYQNQKFRNDQRRYLQQQSLNEDANNAPPTSAKRTIPKIYIPSSLDRVFGGNVVDIKPNGNVLLDFGGYYQKTANPAIPVRQQHNGGFLFNQQIAMNMQGKIGEKLKISINWDTKATFDFENNVKIGYTGFDHDIIKSIEAGVVNFPLNTQLIQGSQNLFGIKTQLQFGRLKVTALLSNQRSKVDEINTSPNSSGSGSAQSKAFEIKADNYEDNKHYFLSQYFRDNYEAWINMPKVVSGMTITRVEVYVTNRNNTTDNTKSIAAFADLGEKTPHQSTWPTPGTITPADNNSNSLFSDLIANAPTTRQADNIETYLQGKNSSKGTDYEVIRTARKLVLNKDYKFNPVLGYISLNTQLRNDDVLGVAYEYRLNGELHVVGELTGSMSDSTNQLAFVKLLRPSLVNTTIPMWNLQMKNVYNLNASNISRAGFNLKIIRKDDNSGIDNPFLPGIGELQSTPIVQLLKCDYLNTYNDPQPDGNYDYVSSPYTITIDSALGRIIFPVLEPFAFNPGGVPVISRTTDQANYNKYVFKEIYTHTKSDLINYATKNKYYLKGSTQSTSSSEISLNGLNISQGSIKVTSGSRQLVEGTDYTVNYDLGKVKIINESILASGNPISIRFEKADLFNFRTKTLTALRLDYAVNKDINIGATAMRMNERPLISRVGIGDEPIKNTMLGADISFKKDSRLLTKAIDKLPFLATKETSVVQFTAEYAALLPGHSKYIGSTGNSFIDDFEGAENPFDLTRSPTRWKIATPPLSIVQSSDNISNHLEYSNKRARMAWYNIDNTFYIDGKSPAPASDKENQYARKIAPQELFPSKSVQPGQINEPTFDVVYYPEEHGPYNYSTDFNSSTGKLNNPQKNYGGIMRPITLDTDFDNSNIQYVEFWLLDPFISDAAKKGGYNIGGQNLDNSNNPGEMYFNFGSMSEDLLKDGLQSYENGLPVNQDPALLTKNNWGQITKSQYLNDAFSNTPGARSNQDIGLDGLNSNDEYVYPSYKSFVDKVNGVASNAELRKRLSDPSGDDFGYFLGDDPGGSTIDRYKYYNGQENNSPEASLTGTYTAASSTVPDNEDLNQNNIIDDAEQYYEYKIKLSPQDLNVGSNYIIGKQQAALQPDGVYWYQFRIPLRDINAKKVGGIEGFKSIRFMRMYLTGFAKPVVLRMAQFQLVAAQWRQYDSTIVSPVGKVTQEPKLANFTVSTVNIEENGSPTTESSGYVLPPGFNRDQNYASTTNQVFNEQSLRLCVTGLEDGNGRAVLKNTAGINFINFESLQMFVHAEGNTLTNNKGDIYAMIRLGTDLTQNFYQILIPLRKSNIQSQDPNEVWPDENSLNVTLSELSALKAARKQSGDPYRYFQHKPDGVDGKIYSIYGNPDFTSVTQMLIGIYNPLKGEGIQTLDDGSNKSACIWVDELRATGFNQKPGQATRGNLNLKLADFGVVTASADYKGIGFGQIETKVSERSTNTTLATGIATTLQLHKLGLEKIGLRLPLYMSYDTRKTDYKFDPSNPDVKLEDAAAVQNIMSASDYKSLMEDRTYSRSINVTNFQKVRLKSSAKPQMYDIENLALTVAYSDRTQTNYLTAKSLNKTYKIGATYAYTSQTKPYEPFKNAQIKSKYGKAVKDFNLGLPNSIMVNFELNRNFLSTTLRNSDLITNAPTQYQKSFFFNRRYEMRWGLTKNLSINYSAYMQAVIDESPGIVESQKAKDSVIANISRGGRPKNYDQTITINYKLPLDKIPLLDWLGADAQYRMQYIWTAGSTRLISLGNTVQNPRDILVNGRIDLNKLYNKSKFLKNINNPKPLPANGKAPEPIMKMKIRRKADGTNDTTMVRVPEFKLLKGSMKFIMSMRSINISYSQTEATIINGYMPSVNYFGIDDIYKSPSPYFLLGGQNGSIIKSDATKQDHEWITKDTTLNDPFKQTKAINLKIGTTLEPIKELRITLNLEQKQNYTYQETYKYKNGHYISNQAGKSGSYSITTITIKTSFFQDDKTSNKDEAFNNFVKYRSVFQQRYAASNPNKDGQYSLNSQDVLISSFLAAYTGSSPDNTKLTSFPKIPLPNWRIDYGGLTKIPAIKNLFSSVNLTHGYTSIYSVGAFQSSAKYGEEYVNLNKSVFDQSNAAIFDADNKNQFVPIYSIGDVSIREQYAPLIGVNIKTKKNITIKVEYKRDRQTSLNITNFQITELKGQDIVFGLGYVKTGMKLPIKSQGRIYTLKNEINMRCDVSIRDSKTILRRIEDLNSITQGNKTVQIKPNVTYMVSPKVNVQVYVDYLLNNPKVSSSFKRSNLQFGVQVRFTLS